MKTIRYALMIAASLVLPACNDAVGPTAPVPSPAVAGHWQGNVSYQALGGFDDYGPCPEQPVIVQLQQEGSTVSGTIQAECVTAEFRGTVYGSTIRGMVTQVVDGFDGQVFSARLNGSLVGSPVSQIEAETELFKASPGFERESFRLRLTR